MFGFISKRKHEEELAVLRGELEAVKSHVEELKNDVKSYAEHLGELKAAGEEITKNLASMRIKELREKVDGLISKF